MKRHLLIPLAAVFVIFCSCDGQHVEKEQANQISADAKDTVAIIKKYYQDHPQLRSFSKENIVSEQITKEEANAMIQYYQDTPLDIYGSNGQLLTSWLMEFEHIQDLVNHGASNSATKLQFLLARKTQNGPLTLVVTLLNGNYRHIYLPDPQAPHTENGVYEHVDPCPVCHGNIDAGTLE